MITSCMDSIGLWTEETNITNGLTTVSATIEYPDQQRETIWYQVPEAYGHLLTSSCDSFTIAMLLTAMEQNSSLRIHGQVSPSLLSNLEEFQAAWHCWCPQRYQKIDIQAEIEKELNSLSQKDRAISTFSGGVDSCFTAFRHRHDNCGRLKQNLQAGLMVHGFDIPLEEPEVFERAFRRSKKMLFSLGMEAIPLATNFRQVVHSNWTDVFAAALASCLMFFQEHYNAGLIPASFSYHRLRFPFGSNPVTDPLLSNCQLKIIHDGALASRAEKIRHISQWPEALENLRVCWEGPEKDRNCGRCEKCIRNILNFRAIGIDSPPCFDRDVSDQEILDLKVDDVGLHALQNVFRDTRAAEIDASWVIALEKCIEMHQRKKIVDALLQESVPTSWKKAFKPLKSLVRYLVHSD